MTRTSTRASGAAHGAHRGSRGGSRRAPRRHVRKLFVGAAIAITGISIGARLVHVAESSTVDPRRLPAREPTPSVDPLGPSVQPSERAWKGRQTLPVPAKPRANRDVPERGRGVFSVAEGLSRTSGTGHLVTYTIEVEAGLPLRAGKVAGKVDAILADPRGWTGTTPTALRRVTDSPTFRIMLASPTTTDRLCAPLDTAGRLSCRNGRLVVLNAWRWVYGADAYRGDLAGYRAYMVNHEFGHALGNAHATCAGADELASVMVQQTKSLQGCRANPWPATR